MYLDMFSTGWRPHVILRMRVSLRIRDVLDMYCTYEVWNEVISQSNTEKSRVLLPYLRGSVHCREQVSEVFLREPLHITNSSWMMLLSPLRQVNLALSQCSQMSILMHMRKDTLCIQKNWSFSSNFYNGEKCPKFSFKIVLAIHHAYSNVTLLSIILLISLYPQGNLHEWYCMYLQS